MGVLVGLAGAVVVTSLMPREYAAQVTIYVSARAGSDSLGAYQGNLLSAQKVKSYAQLLPSDRIAEDVVDELGLDMSPGELAKRISVSSQPDTVLLTITAADRAPQRARQIANATAGAFTRLVTRLETPADGRQAAVTARIVEPAGLPDVPVRPRTVVNLALGVVLGLVAGFGAALLRSMLDTTVKSAEELVQLTGAPNLGTIARDQEVPNRPLVAHDRPSSPSAEGFRKIRTNLQFVDVDRRRKSIVVTSAMPGEGKSVATCNLAIVLGQARRDVVVVEGDLRRPRAAEYLHVAGAVGLTSVLTGRVSLDQAIQPWGVNMFDVLPSGPIPLNPSELLASGRMRDVLAELRERYELVLLDAPPLLPVTDAAVLGAQCDGALLVVRHGRTTSRQVRAALSALDVASVRLLGTTLTMTPGLGQEVPYDGYYGDAVLWDTGADTTTTHPLSAVATGYRAHGGDLGTGSPHPARLSAQGPT